MFETILITLTENKNAKLLAKYQDDIDKLSEIFDQMILHYT
jgi:hypothetical protein